MKYALVLNCMLSPNIENIATVPGSPISTNRQEVVDWYESHKVEPYRDGQWYKTFKKGSHLEWANAANVSTDNDHFGGIYTFREDVSDEAIYDFGLSKY